VRAIQEIAVGENHCWKKDQGPLPDRGWSIDSAHQTSEGDADHKVGKHPLIAVRANLFERLAFDQANNDCDESGVERGRRSLRESRKRPEIPSRFRSGADERTHRPNCC